MKQLIKWATSFVVAVSLAACGGGGVSPGAVGGGGTSSPLTTTAPSGLTVKFGSAQSFAISGGSAPYTAVSNNTGIVVGTVDGTTLTIGGVGPGSASVTITDAKNATVTVPVTVSVTDLSTTAPTSGLTVGVGASPSYTISGGAGPFILTSSNPSVVSVSGVGSDNSFSITGNSPGSATVVLTDKATNKTLSISVAVNGGATLTTDAPAGLTLAVGNAPTFHISGGLAPYSVASSNTNVVAVNQPTAGGSAFTIGALSTGAASVVVTDKAGTKVTVGVTVSASTITLNPSSGTALVGDVLYVLISGGNGSYNAIVSNQAVADATIITLNGRPALKINVKQQASGVPIIVSDTSGNSASFSLSSSPGQPTMQISPSTLTVASCVSGTITMTVYGAGSGTTHLFSSDPSQFTVPASITTTSGTAATFAVTPAAPAGGSAVTITTVDPAGATATSTITVTTPAGGC